jgi:tetratricopeptide (TPR) repeat protein
MSTAYVSGRLGRLICFDQHQAFIEGPTVARREATAQEAVQIALPDSGYELENFESLEDLRRITKERTDDCNYLFLVLSIINPQLSISTRITCAQAVDPSLSNEVRIRLCQNLLSKPLPPDARIESHNTIEYFKSFDNLIILLRELFDSQEAIATVEAAFRDTSALLKSTGLDELRAELVFFKTFPSLVRAMRGSSTNELNTAVVTTLLQTKKSDLAPLPSNTLVEMQRVLQRLVKTQIPQQRELGLEVKAEPSHSRRRAKSIDDLLSDDPVVSLLRLSSVEAKTNVDKQISGIKKQILNGREDLVDKYLRELVLFQINNSERYQLAKSLCLLTSVGLASNQLSMADKISAYAVKLDVDDPVVFTTRAEVLKYQGMFDAALQAYRDAKVRFPDSSYAWNGEADVLKEAGRYHEAITMYKIARTRFADDPVPHNGLVSTLRRMGLLKEATREAQRNIRKFPDDPIVRTELANVFSARGRYREAAMNYRSVLNMDPREIRALFSYVRVLNMLGERSKGLRELEKHVRWDQGPLIGNAIATQLRIMGHIEKALNKSREVVAAFPGYSPARFTLATVLLIAGDYSSAIAELPKGELRSENDWKGYRTYLTCMLAGDPAESVKRLEEAEKKCVWASQKSRIATVLAVAYSRNSKTPEALRILQAGASLVEEHHKQTRIALLGALNAQIGRRQISETILTRILNTRDPSILKFKAAVLTHRNRSSDVLPLLLAA